MTDEYPRQMLAFAKRLVVGSIIGVPYRRSMDGELTIGRTSCQYDENERKPKE